MQRVDEEEAATENEELHKEAEENEDERKEKNSNKDSEEKAENEMEGLTGGWRSVRCPAWQRWRQLCRARKATRKPDKCSDRPVTFCTSNHCMPVATAASAGSLPSARCEVWASVPALTEGQRRPYWHTLLCLYMYQYFV